MDRSPRAIVNRVLSETALQESHWLEWKSSVDLALREWQARIAKFILGAANRPRELAAREYGGRAFMLLGIEAGQAIGISVVDPALTEAGLRRYLGTTGPAFELHYVEVDGAHVAVVTVTPVTAGSRPYLARGTLSTTKPVIQDGRIYIRRVGATDEATADEVDAMLVERLSARMAAGPRWPMQAVDAWRDGNRVHVRLERGDRLEILSADNYSNLSEMARERPELPSEIPTEITEEVAATFDPLLTVAGSDPDQAIKDSWPPLREIAVRAYERLLESEPPHKVIDMVGELSATERIDPRWVDVAYPLYYWPIDQEHHEQRASVGLAKTYVSLAAALATALLLACRPSRSA